MIRSQFLNGYFDYECLIEQLVLHPHKPEIGIEELKDVVRSNVSYRGSSHQEVLPFLGLLMLPHKEDVGEIIKKILKGSNVYRDNESLYRVHMNKKDNGYVRGFLWNWDKSYEVKIKEINSKPPEPSLPIENVFDERSLNKFIRCWMKSIVGVTESVGGNRGKEMTIESWQSPLCNAYRDTLAFEVLSKRNKHPYRKEIEVTPIVRSLYREDLKKALRQKPIGNKQTAPIESFFEDAAVGKVIKRLCGNTTPRSYESLFGGSLLDLPLLKTGRRCVSYRIPLEIAIENMSPEKVMELSKRQLLSYPTDPLVARHVAMKLFLGKSSIESKRGFGDDTRLLETFVMKSPVKASSWTYIIHKLPIERQEFLIRLLSYKHQDLPRECLLTALGLFTRVQESIERRRSYLGSLVFEYIHEPFVDEAVWAGPEVASRIRRLLMKSDSIGSRMHGIFMNPKKRKAL